MSDIISVEGIECYAFHGCLPEEGKIGGKFQVDVFITADMLQAVQSDNLNDAIDYVVVNKIVKEQMAIKSNLIEHVAGRILESLINKFPAIHAIELKVTKFNPPVNGSVNHTCFTLKRNIK